MYTRYFSNAKDMVRRLGNMLKGCKKKEEEEIRN